MRTRTHTSARTRTPARSSSVRSGRPRPRSTFFLTTRPPPRSTLFPYTTLFRSSHFPAQVWVIGSGWQGGGGFGFGRSEEHTSELQSHVNLVCRLLLEKKKSRSDERSRSIDLPPACEPALIPRRAPGHRLGRHPYVPAGRVQGRLFF